MAIKAPIIKSSSGLRYPESYITVIQCFCDYQRQEMFYRANVHGTEGTRDNFAAPIGVIEYTIPLPPKGVAPIAWAYEHIKSLEKAENSRDGLVVDMTSAKDVLEPGKKKKLPDIVKRQLGLGLADAGDSDGEERTVDADDLPGGTANPDYPEQMEPSRYQKFLEWEKRQEILDKAQAEIEALGIGG